MGDQINLTISSASRPQAADHDNVTTASFQHHIQFPPRSGLKGWLFREKKTLRSTSFEVSVKAPSYPVVGEPATLTTLKMGRARSIL